MNQLEQLAEHTTLVADTGDVAAIKRYTPEDATTNPSLLLKAIDLDEHKPLLEAAKVWATAEGGDTTTQLRNATDKLAVMVGREILKIIPGRVSTEVDARLSFSTGETMERARRIISLYEDEGIDRKRVLIKIASTWEGIQAAAALEKESINCNLTLLFSFAQAQACEIGRAHV